MPYRIVTSITHNNKRELRVKYYSSKECSDQPTLLPEFENIQEDFTR